MKKLEPLDWKLDKNFLRPEFGMKADRMYQQKELNVELRAIARSLQAPRDDAENLV